MTRPAKRITSSDVARAAGVSRATVSFVLNDRPGLSITQETRRRVLEAAQRLDYRPHASARSLAAGRSDVVLLSIPDLPIGSGISRFVEELATALAAYGLTLVTHLAGAHGRPLPDVCASVDASAVIGFDPFDHDTIQALYRAGARVVIPPDADPPAATGHLGRAQADHLISRGHRRLGYAAPAHAGYRAMAEERLRGVTDACAEAGIDPPVVLTTTLEIASAAQAVTHWAERSVTGICAFNDETAIAVLAGLYHHGLSAPADLAVIGADDIPTARLATPPLTTVCYDLHQAGRQRAEAVVAGLTGHQDDVALTPAIPQVVQRSST
ncbi:LacI family DNA-binding transcriptional regulator [Streptosporangium sp. KLBMP 9127]|nr:LacI family transcriptional regulator [Streptosporangium sp. KLBMP 9127]